MFVKLVTLALCAASAMAVYNGPLAGGKPADLYPAGVSPQACPNFPNCANPAVAANPNAPGGLPWGSQPQQQWAQNGNQWNGGQNWNSAPQNSWNQPAASQWSPYNQNALDRGEYTGDGDWHGEGLAEALAPGYENRGGWNNNGNQWNNGAQNWAAQPQQAPAGLGAIPAGVDPGSCPNYPFCH